jgi:hypothetical protein
MPRPANARRLRPPRKTQAAGPSFARALVSIPAAAEVSFARPRARLARVEFGGARNVVTIND